MATPRYILTDPDISADRMVIDSANGGGNYLGTGNLVLDMTSGIPTFEFTSSPFSGDTREEIAGNYESTLE